MQNNKNQKVKNKALWTVIFVLIAALSIWAVMSQSKSFSFAAFGAFLRNARKLPLACAVLSMLAFIAFEGISILAICRSFSYKKSFGNGFAYSAADIYFSAITPSATGGQPASAFFMIKDGIPSMFVTVVLIANLMMYTIAAVVIGMLCFILVPASFLDFNIISKVLIIIGFGVQAGLCAIFMLLLTKPIILHKLCEGTIRLLSKLHLMRKKEEKLEKLRLWIDQYASYTRLLKDKRGALVEALFINFLHKISQGLVTMFTYLATGGIAANAFRVFSLQIFVIMGAYCIPVPGAMGVTDYILLDGFNSIASSQTATNLELLSRSLSFYICVIVCGLTVLLKYLLYKRKQKKS